MLSKELIAREFPQLDGLLYLNHAAVSPWPHRTAQEIKRFAEENCRIGARDYLDWVRKETELRGQLQKLINAPDCRDIALVKNTSEALSFVAMGLGWESGDNIVSSSEEFPSNRIPWQSLEQKGVELRQTDLNKQNSAEESLFEQVDSRTRLLTISSIQFASGLRLNVEKIGQFCRQRNVLFCVDAIQSIGALEFDVQACFADFAMADGHKWMLGPEGLGVFYTSPRARDLLTVTQFGWHMIEDPNDYANRPWEIAADSRRFECGSTNMLGIHALSSSLSLLLEIGLETVEAHVIENAQSLKDLIQSEPKLQLITATDPELVSGIVVFKHRNVKNESLFHHLRQNGVVCALRGGGIRFSPHFYTSKTTLERAVRLAATARG
ncbi:MAG: aminotransferase class V-fold PLP-dependent enzyme [Pseudomonadota bacterium]|nr:aminotransferase class V-fold PLP-dependent enzyme [Pseudomonadota bacterium]